MPKSPFPLPLTIQMLRGVPALVRYVSSIMTLEPGDLLLTGTPAGVGRLVPGDTVTAGVVGKVEMAVEVVAQSDAELLCAE